MITSLAFVGQTNAPVYLASFNGISDEDALRQQALLHTALDAIEERLAAGLCPAPGQPPSAFQAALDTNTEGTVHGYASSTGVKILVLDADKEPLREDQLRQLFQTLHAAYVDAACNPFFNSSATIESHKFRQRVETAVTTAAAPQKVV